MKRGQLAIFVILGLLFLFLIAGMVFLFSNTSEEPLDIRSSTNSRAEVLSCVERAGQDVLVEALYKGGVFSGIPTVGGIIIDGATIPYGISSPFISDAHYPLLYGLASSGVDVKFGKYDGIYSQDHYLLCDQTGPNAAGPTPGSVYTCPGWSYNTEGKSLEGFYAEKIETEKETCFAKLEYNAGALKVNDLDFLVEDQSVTLKIQTNDAGEFATLSQTIPIRLKRLYTIMYDLLESEMKIDSDIMTQAIPAGFSLTVSQDMSGKYTILSLKDTDRMIRGKPVEFRTAIENRKPFVRINVGQPIPDCIVDQPCAIISLEVFDPDGGVATLTVTDETSPLPITPATIIPGSNQVAITPYVATPHKIKICVEDTGGSEYCKEITVNVLPIL